MAQPAPSERRSRVADALRSAAGKAREQPRAKARVERDVPRPVGWLLSVLEAAGDWAGATRGVAGGRKRAAMPPVCEPDGPPLVLAGTAYPADEHTYLMLPFDVRPGTSRLEVDYEWHPLPPVPPDSPLTRPVFDLGLWDEKGYRSADGFRGWSGSRHRHVFIEPGRAQRGYKAGPINPGTWHVELGVGAVGPTGAEWRVTVKARGRAPGTVTSAPPAPDPVDPAHVANPHPGWYHGDFHMHAWHSSPSGPEPEQLVGFARAARLDFLPVTEYVVGHHWDEYGAVQRAHPDLVVWPGREIVTYFGHVQSLGETPGFIEYRHGFKDVHIRDIQQAVRAAGALFQVNHPTTFPGPLFRAFCRGCAFDLAGDIDWAAVDTIEVLTGPGLVDPRQYGLPDLGVPVANPFSQTAVDLWERLLNAGFKICAVSGSDDKEGPGLGSSATAVYARELSRPALVEAIRAGRAYVRTQGVAGSPALEMSVVAAGQADGTFGSTMHLDGPEATAEVRVTVTGGRGQGLRVIRNGEAVATVMADADPFEYSVSAARASGEGPLGTWCRVETFDARTRTTIGNPVFLRGVPV